MSQTVTVDKGVDTGGDIADCPKASFIAVRERKETSPVPPATSRWRKRGSVMGEEGVEDDKALRVVWRERDA